MERNAKAGSAVDQVLINRLEVARRLGISGGSVDNLRRRGELASLKIGTRRLFDLRDVDFFVQSRKAVRP